MLKMAIKTYLISCFIILANCNVQATNISEDCEESEIAKGGYFASGSAHSSQYLLPNGESITHSKGSSYSSGGIKETFENLKHEANEFVTKQKDVVNIPNALPPLHSGFDRDLSLQSQNVHYNPATVLNKFESASQQNQKEIYGAAHTGQVYIPSVVPQGSKTTSTKKEQYEINEKVVTHGSPAVYPNINEEIEVGQNGLDSASTGTQVHYIPILSGSSSQNAFHQYSGANRKFETSNSNVPIVAIQKIQAIPFSNTFSKYENSVKQNSTSQIIPGATYVPSGDFTTYLIDFTSNEGQNSQVSNLIPIVGNKVPERIVATPEQHYHKEKDSINYNENTVINSETNTNQKEHKYIATPVNKTPDLPIKIKYVYDGKSLHKTEEYSSGLIKPVPITVEEYENTLKEIHRQESQSKTSQSYGAQPTSHLQPEPEGYYYPIKNQPLVGLPSNVQTFKKEESQSSHSQQTITNGGSSSITNGNIEQFSHLPLNLDAQKQHSSNAGYIGVIGPFSASQISEEKLKQAAEIYAQNHPILVGGAPYNIPISNQHSSSSGSTFQSNSHFAGTNGDFVFPSDFINSASSSSDTLSSSSSAFDKLSPLNQNSGLFVGGAEVPLKSSYGISTSFSSSSSNINGKKSENRQASVSVNDNGKVDTYNVKS